MCKLHTFDITALILVIVGGLNWGLVGLLEFDLVATVFGSMSIVSRIVYVLVALAALYTAVRSPSLAHLFRHEPHPPAHPV